MGASRALKFTKYLPEFGFIPYVLTVRNRSVGVVDATLRAQVPSGTRVIETFSAEHRVLRAPRLLGVDPRWILLPDIHIGWFPFAVREGLRVVRQEGIDLILASAPVFTGFLVGHQVKRRSGLPLVLDFRDPWTQNVFTSYPTRLHRNIEQRMERAVVNAADHIIVTTDAMRGALIESYPSIESRSTVIPNGFDADDFSGLQHGESQDHFTMTYAGRLYGPRTATPFLRALRQALELSAALRSKLRVVFVGPIDRRAQRVVRELALDDVVDLRGFVPHRESLQLMVSSHVLLLLMGQEEGMDDSHRTMMVPGKTFEYLAARRPILAVVPEGSVAALVREEQAGVVVPPYDERGIRDAILRMFDEWQAGALRPHCADLSRFDRKASAARLASILEALVHPELSSTRSSDEPNLSPVGGS